MGRVRVVAVVLVLGLVGLLFPVLAALPASAAQLPVPDSAGAYMLCNVNARDLGTSSVNSGTGAQYGANVAVACAYGTDSTMAGWPVPAKVRVQVVFTNGGGATNSDITLSCDATALRCTGSLVIPISSSASYGHVDHVTTATGSQSTGYDFFVTTNTTQNKPERNNATVHLTAGDTETNYPAANDIPGWPADWYNGAALVTNIAPPVYNCRRDLVQQSDGSWVANLNADGPTGLPADATTGQVITEAWSVPWLTGTVPKVSTVTLPNSGMPVGGWTLEFDATVNVTTSYAFNAPDPKLPAAVDLLGNGHVWWTSGETTAGTGGVTATIWYTWASGVKREARMYSGGVLEVDPTTDATTGGPFTWTNVGIITWQTVTPAMLAYVGQSVDPLTPTPGLNVGGSGVNVAWQVFDKGAKAEYQGTSSNARTITEKCFVLLDVNRPSVGASATPSGTTSPPAPAAGAPKDSGGCNAGPLGDVPLIGGLFDATANLACSIAGVLGKLGELFKWLFIPSDLPWSGEWGSLHAKFPFVAIDQVSGVFGALTDQITETNYGPACGPILDMSGPLSRVSLGADTSRFKVGLPTPSDSGCPGMQGGARTEWDNTLGDVWGYRTLARAIATLFLVLLFVQRVASSFFGGETGFEAGDEEGAES